jgi:raffinose/stachyose/melibiose transport system substrate-binding protein
MEYLAKIVSAFQAGQEPDFFNAGAGVGWLGSFHDANLLVVLNDLIPELKSNFSQPALDSVSVKGDILAVPSTAQVVQVWMNKSAAPSLGADGPATWEELIDLGKSLKAKGIGLIALSGNEAYFLAYVVAAIAATHLSDDFVASLLAGTSKFTDPPFVDVFRKFQEVSTYAQNGSQAASYEDVLAAVGAGKAAGMVLGSWIPRDMEARTFSVPDLQYLMPGPDTSTKRAAAFYFDGGWAASASSPKRDALVELLKISTKPEFGQLIADLQGNLPAMASVSPPTASAPHLARSIELNGSATPQSWWQGSAMDAGVPGINTVLPPICQGIVTGQLTPEEAAKNLQENIGSWFPFK